MLDAMTDISAELPSEIRAGDTAKWQRSFADYPANDSWVLAYTLIGVGGAYNFSGTANGADFLVTVSAASSTGYAPGLYTLTEYVSKAGERYTLNTKSLRILPNLAAAVAASDNRSHAQKMLDAIEAWLESKAPTSASVEIAGRKISNYPLADLLSLRDKYKFELRLENNAAAGNGMPKLLVRF